MGRLGIFGMILRPLQKVGKPKSPDIKVTFRFYRIFCQIDYWCKHERMLSDEWRINTFIYYLARYLYISDERQREAMRRLLSKLFKTTTKDEMYEASKYAYDEITQTLSKQEINAASSIFGMTPPTFLHYPEDDVITDKPFSTYIYSMIINIDYTKTHLHLGLADMILLPLSVIHFYIFICSDLAINNKRILGELSSKLMESFFAKEQSVSWLQNGPESVVKNHPELLTRRNES